MRVIDIDLSNLDEQYDCGHCGEINATALKINVQTLLNDDTSFVVAVFKNGYSETMCSERFVVSDNNIINIPLYQSLTKTQKEVAVVEAYSNDNNGNITLLAKSDIINLYFEDSISSKDAAFDDSVNGLYKELTELENNFNRGLEILSSQIVTAQSAAMSANTAAANAQNITDTVTQKLENGEFNGPQGVQGSPGIQGPPGEPGTTDYLELLNKPIIDIDIAGLTDFYFREQIPGSAKSPCFYRIVSSDYSVSRIENIYLDENHKDEPVYDYLCVGDMFFVYDVSDNTSDGYQLSAFPLVQAENIMQLLNLSSQSEEYVQKTYYAPLEVFEQLVQMITNLNDALNEFETEEKLDIERLQSQTELKLSKKADKSEISVLPEFITDNILNESETYGLDETNGVKTKRNISVSDGSITDTTANKYYSSLIPITRKTQITAFSVGGSGNVNSQLAVAAVVYNKDGVMTSKICGETQNVTSNGTAEFSYEVTKILEPSDDCAFVRLGSTQHYSPHPCQAKIFLSVEEKINAMQAQIDAQSTSVAQEVSE